MVAYSFQLCFEAPIRANAKRHTIRAERVGRARHARPGERLQLYVGMRTRAYRLIAAPLCASVWPIRLDLGDGIVQAHDGSIRQPGDLDAFAVADGFRDWADLVAFWDRHHPGVLVFSGVQIAWAPIPAEEFRPRVAAGGGRWTCSPVTA